jgi:hypothetical protein
MPIALANIGWKMYFINGSWDILILVIMAVWWIETKGKTLEEIDEAIEGRRYSRATDIGVNGHEHDGRDEDVQVLPAK